MNYISIKNVGRSPPRLRSKDNLKSDKRSPGIGCQFQVSFCYLEKYLACLSLFVLSVLGLSYYSFSESLSSELKRVLLLFAPKSAGQFMENAWLSSD
jgi:hypothetical protein